jgi:hypothetical protein
MTWDALVAAEPQLAELHRRASEVSAGPDFCANRVWYDVLKPELVRLVGWEAERPELRDPAAYDLAYTKLYEQLPDCRHESSLVCL